MLLGHKTKEAFNFIATKFFLFFIFGCWLALSQAPFSLSYIALLALPSMAFFWVRFSDIPLESGLAGGIFGLGYFSITMLWIMEPFFVGDKKYLPWLAPFALLFISIYLSLFWSGAFYLATFFGGNNAVKKVLNLALFLTLAELGRSQLFGGFPWGLVSHALIDTPFAQLTSVFGPYFLVFIIYFSYFSMIISKKMFIYSLAFILSLYFIGSYISSSRSPLVEKSHNIRLIQPNIKQEDKWNEKRFEEFYNRYVTLSTKMPRGDLVILPETAMATDSEKMHKLSKKLSNDLGNNIIIGVRRFNKNEQKLYNSILFITKSGLISKIYDKQHLVPFGEYFPFLSWFISDKNKKIYEFSKGGKIDEIYFLDMPVVLPAICYEIIFSLEIGERFENAEWILNLTNDAWFGTFSGPQQHLIQARMRAIELGLPVVRVANTGITTVIRPDGSIYDILPFNKIATLNTMLPAKGPETIYSTFGPRNWLFLLIVINLFCLILLNRKKFKS